MNQICLDDRISLPGCLPPQITAQRVRFHRLVEAEGCFCFDSAGARIGFRTDATEVTAKFEYNGLHTIRTAANGVGVWTIDRQLAGSFSNGSARPGEIEVALTRQESPGLHDYEIILPYGDSVDFKGLITNAGATILPPVPPPRFRYVAYGDSITQGFWASDVTRTFPYLIGAEKQWEVINLGFAGRRATGSDGTLLGQTPADVVTILMGFNDHHQNAPVAEYEQNLRETVKLFRQKQPATPLGVITPLWSSYEPVALENYRQAVRRIATDWDGTPSYFIDGLDLVPADAALFTDGIHPNDRGFAILARNLTEALTKILTR